MNKVILQTISNIGQCAAAWRGCMIWLLLGFPGVIQGQSEADRKWALSVHNRVRQHYINQDIARLQQLTDSVCAIQSATAISNGACAECQGFGYLLNKQFEPAWQAYERAAKYFGRASYTYLEAQGLANAGWAAMQSNSTAQSLVFYKQAEKLLTDHAADNQDSTLLWHVYRNQKILYEIMDNYSLAFEKVIQLHRLAEQIPDTILIAAALEMIMMIYQKFDEMDDAQKYKDQLCRIYETPGKYYNPTRSIVRKMPFAKTAPEADQYLKEADRYVTEPSLLRSGIISEIYYEYAAAMMDKFGQPDIAALYFQKAIDAYKDGLESAAFFVLWSYINLTSIAVQKKQYKKALGIGKQTLLQAKKKGDLSMQSILFKNLGTAFFHTGQTDSAFLYLQKALLMSDSIPITTNDKDFMRSHMTYVYEKEQEVIKFRQEQEQAVVAAQLQRQRLLLWVSGLVLLLLGGLAFAFYRNFRLKQRAADALAQANAALAAEQEKLRLSNAKLHRFSGVVSHDILSNLDLILSAGNVLGGAEAPKANLVQYCNITQDSSRRLKNYCIGLLEEARRMPQAAAEAPHDPMPQVHAVLAQFGTALRMARFRVELSDLSPAPLPPPVAEQLFHNLVSNALRHAATAPDPCLRIAEERDERGGVRWAVEDNGPGLTPEQQTAIFDPQAASKRGQAGQQMGLRLLRDTLREYGADIRVEAAQGGGARFVVLFT